MVFADKYLNYRYKLGYQVGFEEGVELGREEGALAVREVWERYLDEVSEARRTGKPAPPRPNANCNCSERL